MVEKLDAILSSGARFGLHVRADGAMRQQGCHIFDDVSVKTVVHAVIPGGSEWERSLLKVVLSLLTCVESSAGLSAVSVSDNLRLGRALATVAHPTVPLVMRRFDIDLLEDLLRQQFIQESSGERVIQEIAFLHPRVFPSSQIQPSTVRLDYVRLVKVILFSFLFLFGG